MRAPLPDVPEFDGGRVLPGVDLHDTSAILEILDEGRELEVLR